MKRDDVVLLDGAIGTSLWEKSDKKVEVWRYNLDNPAIVRELALEYLDAGAQIIQGNTFGANRPAVKRVGYDPAQVVSEGVRLVREAVAGRAQVALSAGPLSQLMEPYGDLTEDECFEIYDEMLTAGVSQKPDYIILETFMDADMIHIAAKAAAKHGLPILATMSFTEVGKTIMGHSVEYFVETMEDIPLAGIGLNCSLGPAKAVPIIKSFEQYTDLPLVFKPNAGKPILSDGESKTQYGIEDFIDECMPALDANVKYIGGCCGSNPAYIRAMKKRIFG